MRELYNDYGKQELLILLGYTNKLLSFGRAPSHWFGWRKAGFLTYNGGDE